MTTQEAINQLNKMAVTDRDYEAVKVAIDAITKTDELENMEAELERLKNCRHELHPGTFTTRSFGEVKVAGL